jgi:isocitrate/isopropylmalate dehydrogenase
LAAPIWNATILRGDYNADDDRDVAATLPVEPAHPRQFDVIVTCNLILSLAMAFRLSLERSQDADLLEAAVIYALDAGTRTRDIAEPGASFLSCAEMGSAMLADS